MTSDDGPDVLRFHQRAMQLVRMLNHEVSDAALAANGVSHHEFLVLRVVLLGYDRPNAIAARLAFSAPVVARSLAGLERQGLVEVEDDPDDRRRRRVRPTPAGRERHDRTRADAVAIFDARHPDFDRAVLRRAVEAVEALWAAIGRDEGYVDDPRRDGGVPVPTPAGSRPA